MSQRMSAFPSTPSSSNVDRVSAALPAENGTETVLKKQLPWWWLGWRMLYSWVCLCSILTASAAGCLPQNGKAVTVQCTEELGVWISQKHRRGAENREAVHCSLALLLGNSFLIVGNTFYFDYLEGFPTALIIDGTDSIISVLNCSWKKHLLQFFAGLESVIPLLILFKLCNNRRLNSQPWAANGATDPLKPHPQNRKIWRSLILLPKLFHRPEMILFFFFVWHFWDCELRTGHTLSYSQFGCSIFGRWTSM